ncbi:MAG TPA: SDR family NAD(P)-dependent oxidoreductase [Lentimicrobium sp.]|jgi:hypothetical protein|nr:SDR family NAD(P)-dependent oxidoreductase [Lentimicrobium sp.]
MNHTLITGASSGIGKAIAWECAKRGMNLILVSLPGQELEAVARDLEVRYGIKTRYFETDLTKPDSPIHLFNETQSAGLDVNILINNAGVAGASYFDESSIEYIDERILLNIRALVVLTRLYLPVLCKHETSHILNVSSLAAFFFIPYKSVYSASKAFVLSFSRSLSGEVKHRGVRISVVFPNGVQTNSSTGLRIKSHGRIGRWTQISADKVARCAVDGMLKNRFYIIPGFASHLLLFLRMILPVPVQQRLISREFVKEVSATCTHIRTA